MSVKKEEVDEVMSKFFSIMNYISSYEKQEDKLQFIDRNFEICERASKVIKYLIDKNNFFMTYQPQVGSAGNWDSAEALFRIEYDGKRINPDAVFALAEKFGYEKDLTLKVLNRVCQDTYTLKQQTNSDFYVTYNVNPKLINKTFCISLFENLYNNNLSPSSIGIELLEISSFDKIKLSDIKTLKDWGFKILIDDFGSGYADEEVLRKIPFDIIKFSEKVIKGIDKPENYANRERIEDVLKFCRRYSIKTIAEHVETEQELKVVKDMGIDKVQGWFYSRDLPLNTFLENYQSYHA